MSRREHHKVRPPWPTLTPNCDAALPNVIYVDNAAYSATCPPADYWKPLTRYITLIGELRAPVNGDDARVRIATASWFLSSSLPAAANTAIAVGMAAGKIRDDDILRWAESCLKAWWGDVTLTIS